MKVTRRCSLVDEIDNCSPYVIHYCRPLLYFCTVFVRMSYLYTYPEVPCKKKRFVYIMKAISFDTRF